MKSSKKKVLIAPSILSADFSKLGQEVSAVEKAGADWIHVDVMDGHFVPNITIGPVVLESLEKHTSLPFDVHLMISNPENYIEDFVAAGAEIITVHQEAVTHLNRTLHLIRELDVMAGVSINPATPIETLSEVLDFVDLVLVMTVNPGFGGQSMIASCVEKIEKLNEIRKKKKYKFLIEADGGISEKNSKKLIQAGCDVFVAGSSIFKHKSGSYETAIKKLKSGA